MDERWRLPPSSGLILNHLDRKVGYVDSDPSTFHLLRRVNSGAAAAEWIQNNIALIARRSDDSLKQLKRLLRRVMKALFRLRIDWVNVVPVIAYCPSRHRIEVSFEPRDSTGTWLHNQTLGNQLLHSFL
jgi:hypothetical protein